MVVVGIEKTAAARVAAQIEDSQKALRDSIEETKRLSRQVDRLVQQCRANPDFGEQSDR